MENHVLRVDCGTFRFRYERVGNRCVVRAWITSNGFDKNGVAEHDDEYIHIRVTIAGKKGRGRTIDITDFAEKPNQTKKSIHRYGDYMLTIKDTCFSEVFHDSDVRRGMSIYRNGNKPDVYIPPQTNLCVHPNPHHKIEPAGKIPKPYQGGGVSPR